jgi:hypothetical protein
MPTQTTIQTNTLKRLATLQLPPLNKCGPRTTKQKSRSCTPARCLQPFGSPQLFCRNSAHPRRSPRLFAAVPESHRSRGPQGQPSGRPSLGVPRPYPVVWTSARRIPTLLRPFASRPPAYRSSRCRPEPGLFTVAPTGCLTHTQPGSHSSIRHTRTYLVLQPFGVAPATVLAGALPGPSFRPSTFARCLQPFGSPQLYCRNSAHPRRSPRLFAAVAEGHRSRGPPRQPSGTRPSLGVPRPYVVWATSPLIPVLLRPFASQPSAHRSSRCRPEPGLFTVAPTGCLTHTQPGSHSSHRGALRAFYQSHCLPTGLALTNRHVRLQPFGPPRTPHTRARPWPSPRQFPPRAPGYPTPAVPALHSYRP